MGGGTTGNEELQGKLKVPTKKCQYHIIEEVTGMPISDCLLASKENAITQEEDPRKNDLGRHTEDEQFGMSHPLVSRTESGR